MSHPMMSRDENHVFLGVNCDAIRTVIGKKSTFVNSNVMLLLAGNARRHEFNDGLEES
ncbi:hypothetical protein WH47_05679 [Habropoda laboriosa]|uniref:Uncharacterized protein n=1 Tax=Habropoda laboriosa TaxID=597456 RepID=A0A0L7QQY4_9HYME|nr:hypothetical protein WH47_05679 [Habropoda laboriosa]